MNRKFLKVSVLTLAMLVLGACSSDDDNTIASNQNNLEFSLSGLANLGDDYEYEGWIIVNGEPVSTGRFNIQEGNSITKTVSIDETKLASASSFVLSIEPVKNDTPEPSKTKVLIANFNENNAIVTANLIPGLGDFSNVTGKYFLRTPTDEIAGGDNNNGNDENGIWFGNPGAPPTPGFTGMPELDSTAGWRYEGWIVVDGTPISTGVFTKFNQPDSVNGFSGTLNNVGPPVPGEDFFLNAPDGVIFPLDVRDKTTVISLEPYPDNSEAPFFIKPLLSKIDKEAATAPAVHNLNSNLGSFPSGTIIRK